MPNIEDSMVGIMQFTMKLTALNPPQQIQVTFPTPTDFHTSPIFPAEL